MGLASWGMCPQTQDPKALRRKANLKAKALSNPLIQIKSRECSMTDTKKTGSSKGGSSTEIAQDGALPQSPRPQKPQQKPEQAPAQKPSNSSNK